MMNEHDNQTKLTWKLFVDGSITSSICGVGIVLKDPEGVTFEYVLKFKFLATNIVAEYEDTLTRLKFAQ